MPYLIVTNNVDILIISETKLDDSFPTAQFSLHGFSAPYRLDSNSKSGGILLYIRDDIPSRLLNSKSEADISIIFLNYSCNPNKNLISNHLEYLNRTMDVLSRNYYNVIFVGYFNACINDNDVLLIFK